MATEKIQNNKKDFIASERAKNDDRNFSPVIETINAFADTLFERFHFKGSNLRDCKYAEIVSVISELLDIRDLKHDMYLTRFVDIAKKYSISISLRNKRGEEIAFGDSKEVRIFLKTARKSECRPSSVGDLSPATVRRIENSEGINYRLYSFVSYLKFANISVLFKGDS